MFMDLWRYATAPFPWYLAPMGYVRESTGLVRRGGHSRAAWREHLEKSKALILEAASRCARKDKALILGSGLLHDIPMAELSGQFREVVLVDILHLREARSQARGFANVRLVPLDVTGVAKAVYDLARGGRPARLPDSVPDFFLDDGFDFVASLNMLSQLPVVPGTFAGPRIPKLAREDVVRFSRRLVEHHLDWLCSFSGAVSLITDLDRLECDGATVLRRKDCLWGVELPAGGRTWLWDIAPRPVVDPRFDVRHRVIAFADFPKGAWRTRFGDLD